jgi:hypothetical protein
VRRRHGTANCWKKLTLEIFKARRLFRAGFVAVQRRHLIVPSLPLIFHTAQVVPKAVIAERA